MIEGVVRKSTGSWYEVWIANDSLVMARLKGLIRLDYSKDTNPVAVGDVVYLENDGDTNDWMIVQVKDRKNYIVRASPKHKGARQVIAANLDQCVLIATLDSPRTSTGFIDRFLMAAEDYGVPTIIVFNKQDLLDPKGQSKQKATRNIYEQIGYQTIETSTVSGIGLEELKQAMTKKTSLIWLGMAQSAAAGFPSHSTKFRWPEGKGVWIPFRQMIIFHGPVPLPESFKAWSP